MASKPALIRQSDVTKIVKGFIAAGITPGITVSNGKVLIAPVDDLPAPEAPSALERFRAVRHASKARGHS